MTIQLKNNAASALAGAITNVATTLNVTAGQGALFPSLAVGDYFYATLQDSSNNLEIIKVTARSTDTFTIVRGQEGTTGLAFGVNTAIELRWTAQAAADYFALQRGSYLTKSVAGGTDVTLTSIEAANGVINLTGLITANINVIVPVAVQQWVVINSTTGAFTLTFKAVSGTGIVVAANTATILVFDGTNMRDLVVPFTAPLASPTFTGDPKAPTPAAADNDTSIATTAFVETELSSGRNAHVPVRQTVLFGAQDSNGYASHLSAGAGLNFNVSATSVPLVITYAGGFGAQGDIDTVTRISADASNQGSLAASNLNYINSTRVTDTSVTWGSTLAPPQYGYAYDKTRQSSLTLNNVSTDDFGNSWTNTAVTFSNVSPKFSGTFFGIFNGTTSNIKSTAFTTLGSGGWTLRCAVNPTSVASIQDIVVAINAGGFGAQFRITAAAKIAIFASSTGTTQDIVNGTASTTSITAATWTDLEYTYDPVAGKLFFYINGVAEAALTTTATAKVCSFTSLNIGYNGTSAFFGGNIQGFEFLPYCKHPNGTTFTPQTALASVSAAGYASDFFSIPAMIMYGVTAASASAGTNPTLTAKNVVYHGEMTTNATNVVSTVNYAYKGQYVSADTTIPGLSTKTTFAHNIGVQILKKASIGWRCYTTDVGIVATPGQIAWPQSQGTAGSIPYNCEYSIDRNNLSWTSGNNAVAIMAASSNGAAGNPTAANWKMFMILERFF